MDFLSHQHKEGPPRPKEYPNGKYDPHLYATQNGRYTYKFRLVDDKTYFTHKPDIASYGSEPMRLYYHVKAWNSRNKEIVNTYNQRAPLYTSLGRGEMIKCFEEAMPWIPFGRKARLECSAELCYGHVGVQGSVEPNEPLRFEVELLSMDKQFLE